MTLRANSLISIAEAARRLGVSRQWVYELVATGKLEKIEVGGHLFVLASEVVKTHSKIGGRTGGKTP